VGRVGREERWGPGRRKRRVVSWGCLEARSACWLTRISCSGWTTSTTHSQELDAFQALAGDYCDELHFGEEADF
jgi:hypothetical protein